MVGAIILAAGKGTRINSKTVNKVALPFMGKPMLWYGMELFKGVASRIVIVVGAFSHSVKDIVNGEKKKAIFAYQQKRLGTAHAAKKGLEALEKFSPQYVLIGMGDHLMFYKKSTIKHLLETHKKNNAVVSFVTTVVADPKGYGRVERNKKREVLDIVEEKDATAQQKKLKEINAGLYCFDTAFLKTNINRVKKSEASGEYYLTDIIRIATQHGKQVTGFKVPFQEVGIGVNRILELEESEKLYQKLRTTRT